VLDRANSRDGFSMKKPFRSSAKGASFHTKHASNANVDGVVLLDANSYLALRYKSTGKHFDKKLFIPDDKDNEYNLLDLWGQPSL
jgi:hypothetical protein